MLGFAQITIALGVAGWTIVLLWAGLWGFLALLSVGFRDGTLGFSPLVGMGAIAFTFIAVFVLGFFVEGTVGLIVTLFLVLIGAYIGGGIFRAAMPTKASRP